MGNLLHLGLLLCGICLSSPGVYSVSTCCCADMPQIAWITGPKKYVCAILWICTICYVGASEAPGIVSPADPGKLLQHYLGTVA